MAYYALPRIVLRAIMFFQQSRLSLVRISQCDEVRARGRNIRQRRVAKRWKITFLFARRYLGDRKSYREERKRVLKGKVPRFQSSFARRLEIVVFQVTAVQSFRNFNTVWSEANCPTVTAFLSRSIYNICTGCANIAGVELNVERDRFLVEPHTWLDYCRKVNNWTEKVSLFLTYIFWREAAWTALKIQSRRNSQRRNF